MNKTCLGCAAFALGFSAAPSVAQPSSVTRSMSFDQCLQTIRSVSTSLRVAPVNLVETNILRMVRFRTRDGSVLVTCSRPDRRMVITQNNRR